MKHSEIIKKIRKENFGLSQQKLADALEINKSTINNIEQDAQKISFDLAKKLNQHFGYEPEALMNGELIKEEEAPKYGNWQQELNLTDSECEDFIKLVKESKYKVFLALDALKGNEESKQALFKLLYENPD